MFQSTEKLHAMMSLRAFVLVLTLVVGAVIGVHGEEETTTEAMASETTEKPGGFAEAAKEKWQQGVEAAKKGIAKAEEALNNAKEKIGPMASNFSEGVKEKFHEGVQKAQDMFNQAKQTISSHVSPFVNNVRKGMLDGVRNLRDKLHKKDAERGNKGGEARDEGESSEKATVKAEINSGEDGA